MFKKHFIVSLSTQTSQSQRCPLSQGASLPQQHSWHSRTGVMWQGVDQGQSRMCGLGSPEEMEKGVHQYILLGGRHLVSSKWGHPFPLEFL